MTPTAQRGDGHPGAFPVAHGPIWPTCSRTQTAARSQERSSGASALCPMSPKRVSAPTALLVGPVRTPATSLRSIGSSKGIYPNINLGPNGSHFLKLAPNGSHSFVINNISSPRWNISAGVKNYRTRRVERCSCKNYCRGATGRDPYST